MGVMLILGGDIVREVQTPLNDLLSNSLAVFGDVLLIDAGSANRVSLGSSPIDAGSAG